MNFRGPARPLTDSDVWIIAGYLGVHVAAIRAVLAIESAGRGFGLDKRPIILNEPHIFFRELTSAAKRQQAVAEGLAYQRQGMKPYPKTQAERYAWLDKAMEIDEEAALKSCSWGLGQVMGFNYRVAGFSTVQEFVAAMTASEGAHLYAMARFIVSNNLQGHLRSLSWADFARGYNGAGYAANKYDTKLDAAYAGRPGSEKVTPPAATPAQLAALTSGAPSLASKPPAKPSPRKPLPAPKTTGSVVAGTTAGAAATAAGFEWMPAVVIALFAAVAVAVIIHFVRRGKDE